jgi:opacity protein-like surface antigen
MRDFILFAVLALAATAARAENGFFYLGAGATSSSLSDSGELPDLKNNSWKAYVGVRPFKWVAVELDYIDLGSGSSTPFYNTQSVTVHEDGSAWAAYAVGILPVPLPVVEFYGKAGIARPKLNNTTTTTVFGFGNTPPTTSTTSTSNSSSGFAWGIGAQAHFSIAGLRLEYESFAMPDSSTAKVASLSVFLNF